MVVLALLVCVAPLGCARTRQFTPDVDYNEVDSAIYVHHLVNLPLVTFAEACRAVLILSDGQDPGEDFEQRVSILEERGVVRPEWGLQPGQVLDKGTFAYMIYKACRMPGNFNCVTLGRIGIGDRRYVLRELVSRGIFEKGIEYQIMTGGEVVAVLGRADAFMAKTRQYESTTPEVSSPRDVD